MRENPNYDILNNDNVRSQIPTMSHLCNYIWQDPRTFLDLYLPLRLHPVTRQTINDIILTHKPVKKPEEAIEQQDEQIPKDENEIDLDRLYYYGLVMIKQSIVTIFKNSNLIKIESADLNSIINHIMLNVES